MAAKEKKGDKNTKAESSVTAPVLSEESPPPRVIAVIDIGTASIRLNLSELHDDGRIQHLEALNQTVSLGQEVFASGSISLETMRRAVEILSQFKDVMTSYGVTRARDIRAVATSAVRDAVNRQTFLDRVFIATGLIVEVIDQAAETRLTYMSIEPLLRSAKWGKRSQSLVVEVGGGSTEVLLLHGLDVRFSQSYRLGSLRLLEALEAYQLTGARLRQALESRIERTIEQMYHDAALSGTTSLLALSGETRWAAAQLVPDWDQRTAAKIPVASLETLVDKVLECTPDQLVRKYHLTYADAETLGVALLIYLQLARVYKCKQIRVATATMRDGLIAEMAAGGEWSSAFQDQILQSAMELGRKYEFDEDHAVRVAKLSRRFFDVLQKYHGLDQKYGLLLYAAALLHEIGHFISYQSHHKHSMYLIRNSELFGLGNTELLIVSLVARYHRRATPKPTHDVYGQLSRRNRLVVKKLAAILRVADALERGYGDTAHDCDMEVLANQLVIYDRGLTDISMEQMALTEKGDMLEELYGLTPVLRSIPRKDK